MHSTVKFYGGFGRPSHMTEESYRTFLAFDHVKEATKEYAEFAGKCQIGDEPGYFDIEEAGAA
jgi:hypothetical protein